MVSQVSSESMAVDMELAGIVDSERTGLWAYHDVIPGSLEEFSAWLREPAAG
jgi:hypothetical protein